MEVNLNHPVVKTLHDQWHTIVAILINKLGEETLDGAKGDKELCITMDDTRAMPTDKAIVVVEIDEVLHLKLIDAKAAMRLARKEGGLPT